MGSLLYALPTSMSLIRSLICGNENVTIAVSSSAIKQGATLVAKDLCQDDGSSDMKTLLIEAPLQADFDICFSRFASG